jgi:hypothetical protein
MAKKTFVATRNVFHNGELFAEGVEFSAEAEEVAQAVESGALVEVEGTTKAKPKTEDR